MKLGIGIDTGGTYTDAVLYDFTTGNIMESAKSLTTKEDLSIGILGALDQLPAALLQQAELIALSTTLATNACVEDKGGSAKLLFFGGDPKTIDELGGQYGLPPAKDIYIQESFTKFSGEIEREPDWSRFREELKKGYDVDGVGILELNAMRNGAVVEKKAKEVFQEQYSIPVVCGHELFSELNCLQRASSTLLNARLFPVIQEFLDAIQKALALRGISAALVIVRSDGSLMSEQFASLRPVETLLCGPAASTIGGTHLANRPNSIIVDMGGTTTDIALVTNGKPVTVVDGVSIGKWKTFVDGLYIKTIGLGGDSAIHYQGDALVLEEYRVVPLCVLAKQYPCVLENLKELAQNPRKHTLFLYEHYLLVKDINGSTRYTAEEQAFCAALKSGPLLLSKAAEAVGKDIYTLDVSRLLREGIVQKCGLTPTDIMHIRGDFTKYEAAASLLGAKIVAFNLGLSVEDLCSLVYQEVEKKIYSTIVRALLEHKLPKLFQKGVSKEAEALIEDAYYAACSGRPDPMLTMPFHTQYALVGIGAPIRIFLEPVAKLLGTSAVIPEHYEVANALGAIMGHISASYSVNIMPSSTAEGVMGYTVFGCTSTRFFEEWEKAEAFAVEEAKQGAEKEARKRGAAEDITITCRGQSCRRQPILSTTTIPLMIPL